MGGGVSLFAVYPCGRRGGLSEVNDKGLDDVM
jgi:hypothetical protein